MEFPNITIDNIRFQLEGYNPPTPTVDRACLKIRSFLTDGRNYELYMYQSESSLGFWRLGCWDRGMMYKGSVDYVQQTFIHFSLQQFINNNISKIERLQFKNTHPELTEKLKAENSELLTNSFPFCYTKLTAFKSTREYYIPIHINDVSRIVTIDAFTEFNRDESKRCGFLKVSPEAHLKAISAKLSEKYLLDRSSIQFMYTDTYTYNNTNIHDSPVKLHIISNYFNCHLISKDGKANLYLYYMIYNIVNQSSVHAEQLLVDRRYFPLFLTTSKRISPFGTFEYYVLSASYICKLFEHRKQSDTFGQSVSKDHQYIGYLYDDLFPFNEIKKI